MLRYGGHAMQFLVARLLAHGAHRRYLRAKLFGGARMLAGSGCLGPRNADFAEAYLRRADIPVVGGSLRGERGRRIEFWPVAGRTRQLLVGRPAEPFDPGSAELL